jgi:hypothetical protein
VLRQRDRFIHILIHTPCAQAKMPFPGKGYRRNREASDQLEKITL